MHKYTGRVEIVIQHETGEREIVVLEEGLDLLATAEAHADWLASFGWGEALTAGISSLMVEP